MQTQMRFFIFYVKKKKAKKKPRGRLEIFKVIFNIQKQMSTLGDVLP